MMVARVPREMMAAVLLAADAIADIEVADAALGEVAREGILPLETLSPSELLVG
jgi:hypothetical protein